MKNMAPVNIEIGNLLIRDVLSFTPTEFGNFITGVLAFYGPTETHELIINIRDATFASHLGKNGMEMVLNRDNVPTDS